MIINLDIGIPILQWFHLPYLHYYIFDIYVNTSFHFSCTKSRGIFDKCVFDKLGVEKTELGHFSRVC